MKNIFYLSSLVAILGITSISAISPKRQSIVNYARKHTGTPYVFGGNDITSGIDCSAYVKKVMAENGIKLPRTAAQQYKEGRHLNVPPEKIFPGDLVFFQTYRPGASHVGIYSDEEGKFLHASSSKGTSVALMSNPWWNPRYLGAKRLIEDDNKAAAPKKEEAKKPIVTPAPKTKIGKNPTKKTTSKETKTVENSGEKPVKKKSLKKVTQEIAEFQEKQSYLKEHTKRVRKIAKWVNKNKKLAGRVCPRLYKNPLKTFIYDTSYRTARMRRKLKFGTELILIGGSKPKKILGKRDVANACVVLPDNKIDLINSKAISVFPAEGLISPPCKNLKRGKANLQVRVNKAPLEMHFLEYENVYGEMIKPVKIKARWVGKNKKLKAIGTVRRGRQAGDYCVDYKGNVFNIYNNNVKVL